MATTPRVRDGWRVRTRFPDELRRWLTARQPNQLDLAVLRLEAMLPADGHTADVLRRRWG
jgi:hypothetical protein